MSVFPSNQGGGGDELAKSAIKYQIITREWGEPKVSGNKLC